MQNDVYIRTGAYPFTDNERIEEVAATFDIEGMPLSERNIQELRDVEFGKTTTQELREKYMKELERSR